MLTCTHPHPHPHLSTHTHTPQPHTHIHRHPSTTHIHRHRERKRDRDIHPHPHTPAGGPGGRRGGPRRASSSQRPPSRCTPVGCCVCVDVDLVRYHQFKTPCPLHMHAYTHPPAPPNHPPHPITRTHARSQSVPGRSGGSRSSSRTWRSPRPAACTWRPGAHWPNWRRVGRRCCCCGWWWCWCWCWGLRPWWGRRRRAAPSVVVGCGGGFGGRLGGWVYWGRGADRGII
jgi:hypothetical protein